MSPSRPAASALSYSFGCSLSPENLLCYAGEVVVEVPDDAVLMAENCGLRDVLEGED